MQHQPRSALTAVEVIASDRCLEAVGEMNTKLVGAPLSGSKAKPRRRERPPLSAGRPAPHRIDDLAGSAVGVASKCQADVARGLLHADTEFCFIKFLDAAPGKRERQLPMIVGCEPDHHQSGHVAIQAVCDQGSVRAGNELDKPGLDRVVDRASRD